MFEGPYLIIYQDGMAIISFLTDINSPCFRLDDMFSQ